MKVEFTKYTDKDNFFIVIVPTIAFNKESSKLSVEFAWLCFVINIEF